jgi:hypothetical protein
LSRRYYSLADGEIRIISGKRGVFLHKLRCCDCSLTHMTIMRVVSPSRAEFAAWRDKRATAARRRRGA